MNHTIKFSQKFISSLTLVEDIGLMMGKLMFSKRASISVNQKNLDGKILYIGRRYLHFREDFSDKTLRFEKEGVKL